MFSIDKALNSSFPTHLCMKSSNGIRADRSGPNPEVRCKSVVNSVTYPSEILQSSNIEDSFFFAISIEDSRSSEISFSVVLPHFTSVKVYQLQQLPRLCNTRSDRFIVEDSPSFRSATAYSNCAHPLLVYCILQSCHLKLQHSKAVLHFWFKAAWSSSTPHLT